MISLIGTSRRNRSSVRPSVQPTDPQTERYKTTADCGWNRKQAGAKQNKGTVHGAWCAGNRLQTHAKEFARNY